jgi:hypothetical protein
MKSSEKVSIQIRKLVSFYVKRNQFIFYFSFQHHIIFSYITQMRLHISRHKVITWNFDIKKRKLFFFSLF